MKNWYIEGYAYHPSPHPFRTEAVRLAAKFETDAYVENGIVRWKSNNSVPPTDILEFWAYLKKPFDYQKSLEQRDIEVQESLARYREAMKNHVPSEEELYEMRAAFGEGATVVNVITGKTTKL
ncbi:hypothetical protein P4H32_31920 [Bacillus cereus]|nr:hypothetical protein [Bacillus cereus]